MIRRLLPALLLAVPLAVGCAGPNKLAERSESKLAQGDLWRSWTLATQALDKAPGNPRAQAAASAAAAAISQDWQRRIDGLAAVDSMAAADQVLQFVSFRAKAARYTTVEVPPGWQRGEKALLQGAAQAHYASGVEDLASHRPKRAYGEFNDAERYVPGYRDAARLADTALQKAITRVAFLPLRSASGDADLGRQVAASWTGDVVEHLSPPGSHFSRILPEEDVERVLRVSDLGRITREDAIRIGRRAGADRVVWGTIGKVSSKSSIHFFSDRVAHRIVGRDDKGERTTRWTEVPLDVVSRVRTVNVDLEYEVIATRGGATLARQHDTRTMKARVVWTAYSPEGSPDSYSLVSDETRSAHPDRAKQIEAKWAAAVGDGTTLAQVLEARRSSTRQSRDPRQAVGRFIAGAAFVMMEDLPSTDELEFGALAGGWKSVYHDLLQLDPVDDVDLGVSAVNTRQR